MLFLFLFKSSLLLQSFSGKPAFFLLLNQGIAFCSELKVKKERKTLVLNLSACVSSLCRHAGRQFGRQSINKNFECMQCLLASLSRFGGTFFYHHHYLMYHFSKKKSYMIVHEKNNVANES